jgi:hypothetical protein
MRRFQAPADAIRRLLFLLLIGAAVVAYGILHLQVPMFADDYCRSLPDMTLAKALALAWKQYFTWSGRFPVMTVNWLAFSSGAVGVALVSVVSAAMLFLLCRTVVGIRDKDAPYTANILLLVCLLFLWWMTPDTFGEVALWKTGTVQYFWGMVIAVYCLAPVLRLAVHGQVVEYGPVQKTIHAGACLAGGMWLEHPGVAVSAVWLLLMLVVRFVQKREVPTWLWITWGLWTLGVAALIAAPGNYERAEVLGEHNVLSEKLRVILERLLSKVDAKLWLAYAVFLAVSLLRPVSRAREQVLFSAVFALLALLCAVTLAGAPNIMFFGRIAYPSEFFLVLAVVFAFPVHVFSAGSHEPAVLIQKSALVAMGIMMFTLLVIDYRNVFNVYSSVRQQVEERQERVARARHDPEAVVELRPLYFSAALHTGNGEINQGRLFARDVTGNPDHWLNVCYRKAHGLESVALAP